MFMNKLINNYPNTLFLVLFSCSVVYSAAVPTIARELTILSFSFDDYDMFVCTDPNLTDASIVILSWEEGKSLNTTTIDGQGCPQFDVTDQTLFGEEHTYTLTAEYDGVTLDKTGTVTITLVDPGSVLVCNDADGEPIWRTGVVDNSDAGQCLEGTDTTVCCYTKNRTLAESTQTCVDVDSGSPCETDCTVSVCRTGLKISEELLPGTARVNYLRYPSGIIISTAVLSLSYWEDTLPSNDSIEAVIQKGLENPFVCSVSSPGQCQLQDFNISNDLYTVTVVSLVDNIVVSTGTTWVQDITLDTHFDTELLNFVFTHFYEGGVYTAWKSPTSGSIQDNASIDCKTLEIGGPCFGFLGYSESESQFDLHVKFDNNTNEIIKPNVSPPDSEP